MKKQNCWEFKKCGRNPGGENEKKLGACPVPVASRLDGAHGGKNGGRVCWLIARTMCDGKVQGTFAEKVSDCLADCDFYKKVKREEGGKYGI